LFAGTFPRRTKALILAAGQARIHWAPDYPWGFTEDQLTEFLRAMDSGWGTEAYAARAVAFSASSMVEDREYIRWVAKVQRHWVGPSTAAALERQFFDSDVTEVLRSIRVPTLVIAREWEGGEEDEHVASLIPDATLVRLPGVDWMMWVGDQDSVVEAIHGFLHAEPAPATSERVLATLLFTDIVGSTELASSMGDRAFHELLARHHEVVRSMLERYRGHEIDSAGDGFFATFDGPARAIGCAGEITDAVGSLGMRIRAGVHTGEVELAGESVRGISVHIGARVGALAAPGEVLVSQTVKDLVAGSGFAFEDAGEHELKGVPDRWRLYRVVKE